MICVERILDEKMFICLEVFFLGSFFFSREEFCLVCIKKWGLFGFLFILVFRSYNQVWNLEDFFFRFYRQGRGQVWTGFKLSLLVFSGILVERLESFFRFASVSCQVFECSDCQRSFFLLRGKDVFENDVYQRVGVRRKEKGGVLRIRCFWIRECSGFGCFRYKG